jgi:glycosyltransferase involved in cell wall biosynthesis
LRVLMVLDNNYPGIGGAELQVRLLSRALAARGHEVKILAPRLDPTRPVHDTVDGIEVERIPYPRVRVLGSLILMLRFAWYLLRTRESYDAIHVHIVKNLATVAGLLCPFLRASVVIKVSGAWEFDGGVLDPAKRRQPLTLLRNACIRGVDYVQCISVYTRRRLREADYPECKLRMIHNAVDLDRYQSTDGARGGNTVPIVVFVGRMRPVKGVDVLVRAWKEVQVRNRARLVLAGDGPIVPDIKKLASDSGVADSIEFLGEISTVPDLLRRSDIYVQPSYQEGMPNSVLEAMATGLPIVATKISGNEDLVEDGRNGLLVPPGDATALARAIERLLVDPLEARRMGDRSRAIVSEQYGLPVVVSKLVRTYQGEAAA